MRFQSPKQAPPVRPSPGRSVVRAEGQENLMCISYNAHEEASTRLSHININDAQGFLFDKFGAHARAGRRMISDLLSRHVLSALLPAGTSDEKLGFAAGG